MMICLFIGNYSLGTSKLGIFINNYADNYVAFIKELAAAICPETGVFNGTVANN